MLTALSIILAISLLVNWVQWLKAHDHAAEVEVLHSLLDEYEEQPWLCTPEPKPLPSARVVELDDAWLAQALDSSSPRTVPLDLDLSEPNKV